MSMSMFAALLGAWASGGGELYGDARNPWFLQNTKAVTYCVEIDEATFGVSRATAQKLVKHGLDYWVEELQNKHIYQSSDVRWAYPGMQDFTETACAAETDIRFQFGRLTDEQRAGLGDLSRFAAITIRTDYDLKRLRGKGFVYLSPQSAWSTRDNALLRKTLMHEMGHIFGLGHFGRDGLMSERYVERLLKDEADPLAESDAEDPQVLRFRRHDSGVRCGREGYFNEKTVAFFDIPASFQCRRYELDQKGLRIFAKADKDTATWTLDGEMRSDAGMSSFGCAGGKGDDHFPIRVFLSPEQTVFRDPDVKGKYAWKTGWPNANVETCTATYKSVANGIEREIVVRMDHEWPRIGGVLDGKYHFSVF